MAEIQSYKMAQKDHFSKEILILHSNETLPIANQIEIDKSSVLHTLSPYLDDDGIMRLKGRIDAATVVSISIKRSIIMPKNHHITRLILSYYHQIYHHVNHQTVINEVRQKFYVPSLRVALKSVRFACQNCKIMNAKPTYPEMSDLPAARLAAFKNPFTFVGIDYFGPMFVKVNRHTEKRWGVLFTCLTTRGIHLEVAHSLTIDSCIMSITNFMCRRGISTEFYSDNGTNFHGTERELQQEFQNIDQLQIIEKFTSTITQWKFNPPAAPHMGGSWERLIRTAKSCLRHMMSTRLPNDEQLINLFVEVELIINSRPLTYISLNSDEDDVLTPNHFLLGSSSGNKVPYEFSSTNTAGRRQWKAVQELSNQCWRRFVRTYLPTLTRRTKWFKKVKPLEVNDVVLIIDENNPRNSWPKEIIQEVIIGKGQQVRQVIVKTNKGTYKRPTAKIALLDVNKGSPKKVKLRTQINGREC